MNTKRYINFKKIGLALIFLFNPNIAVVDVLPDFIGYILLCLALVNLADINETIKEAQTIFKRMIFVDGAKLIAIMWIFGISVTNEQNSSLLFWSFAFSVLELIFLIPAFSKLFKGLDELGYLYDNMLILGAKKGSKNGKSRTDKLKSLTLVFLWFKAILSFLPEFSDITSTNYYENEGIMNLYRYIGIMRFLAFIPVFVLGVIWIVKWVRYFMLLNSDSAFIDKLD